MRTLIRCSALLLVLAAVATPADSMIMWPIGVDVTVDFGAGPTDDCWDLNQDRSFTSCSGALGNWEGDIVAQTLEVTYSDGTVYTGSYTGVPWCVEGTAVDGASGRSGPWTGCKQ